MLLNQKSAVDRNMLNVVEALAGNITFLLNYLESRGVISNSERDSVESTITSAGKLNLLFGILKATDSGWPHLLSYLREHNQSTLADKLQNEADGETVNARQAFSLRLAEYYQLHYAHVPTMWESPKHVKDVWVPLQIDGRSEDFLAADRIGHVDLLSRLTSSTRANVALIKGDPGMGKTTLVKKIAYDWAISYESTTEQHLKLVLAVPLRSAGTANRFDQMAIDYFLSILHLDDIDRAELMREIKHLEFHLLVILDGLDEFHNYSESPFKHIFAAPFRHSPESVSAPLPTISFNLIITSRPYACENINREFVRLQFVVLPLDAHHLGDFVSVYCETERGLASVREYLKTNAKLVIQVPLLLTFVCYLAESVQEIPTNMTSLFDELIRQMIRRETRLAKLTEHVDLHKWKESRVVASTGKLAYRGRQGFPADNVEFPSESLESCHVSNDSFICGFLLHKYDFARESLMAEFPHRSIQDFFAALHFYQLMLNGNSILIEDSRRQILQYGDTQLGRFFFGICSNERQFDTMLSWLNPSLASLGYPWIAINLFGTNLTDCTSEENRQLGQILFESVGEVEGKVANSWNSYWPINENCLSPRLGGDFKEALNLVDVKQDWVGRTYEWYLSDQTSTARLVVAMDGLVALLKMRFDQIDILIWHYQYLSVNDWKMRLGRIKSLPLVRTLVMETRVHGPFKSVTICIRYGQGLRSVLALSKFRLTYVTKYRDEMLDAISNEKIAELTVVERIEHDNDKRFLQLKVIVDDYRCLLEQQSALILSLIRQSLS